MFEFNETTEFILGRPNFWCSRIAHVMQKLGQDIKPHAEEEQAAVIYWMLKLYEEHGDNWGVVMGGELQRMIDEVKELEAKGQE